MPQPLRPIIGELRPGHTKGGRGKKGPQAIVDDLLARGCPPALSRDDLRARGFKSRRIWELLGGKDDDGGSVKSSLGRCSAAPSTLDDSESVIAMSEHALAEAVPKVPQNCEQGRWRSGALQGSRCHRVVRKRADELHFCKVTPTRGPSRA